MGTHLAPWIIVGVLVVFIFVNLYRYVRNCHRAMTVLGPCANSIDEIFTRVGWTRYGSAASLEYALTRAGFWCTINAMYGIGKAQQIDQYAICTALNALCKVDVQWIASPHGYTIMFDEKGLAGMIHWDVEKHVTEVSEGPLYQ